MIKEKDISIVSRFRDVEKRTTEHIQLTSQHEIQFLNESFASVVTLQHQ
jgi:hypothetical protein